MSERMTEAEIADLNVRRINRDGRAEVLCTKAFYEIAALRAEIERLTRKARFNDISVLPEKDAEYAALRAEVEKLRAALEIMSMMGGYTKLHPDETAPGVEQNTYSWGVSDGYKEMAEIARAALDKEPEA